MNNKVIKAVIIEDEINALEALLIRLKNSVFNIDIVGTADSINKGIEIIESCNPDLVFLDIELPDGNGFEIIDHFNPPDFDVIFTTAFNQYAIKAFKVSALDYLLKPIDGTELNNALQKYIERQSKPVNSNSRFQVFTDFFSKNKNVVNKIVLPNVNGFDIVEISEIIYCCSDRNYTEVHFCNKTKHIISLPLKHIEEILTPFEFIRIHNSFLINMSHIKKYIKGKIAKVVLTNDIVLNVSQVNRNNFLEFLLKA